MASVVFVNQVWNSSLPPTQNMVLVLKELRISSEQGTLPEATILGRRMAVTTQEANEYTHKLPGDCSCHLKDEAVVVIASTSGCPFSSFVRERNFLSSGVEQVFDDLGFFDQYQGVVRQTYNWIGKSRSQYAPRVQMNSRSC